MNLLDRVIERLVERGIRPDTYTDHWRCRICATLEPHVHEYGTFPRRYYEDHGYDIRDEEQQ